MPPKQQNATAWDVSHKQLSRHIHSNIHIDKPWKIFLQIYTKHFWTLAVLPKLQPNMTGKKSKRSLWSWLYKDSAVQFPRSETNRNRFSRARDRLTKITASCPFCCPQSPSHHPSFGYAFYIFYLRCSSLPFLAPTSHPPATTSGFILLKLLRSLTQFSSQRLW